MSDEPKSAIELAMERLQAKDREEGTEQRSLTDQQRAAIGDVRQMYEAKFAELEILHRSRLRKAQDYDEQQSLEEEYRRDRERLGSERDSKLEKLRREA